MRGQESQGEKLSVIAKRRGYVPVCVCVNE